MTKKQKSSKQINILHNYFKKKSRKWPKKDIQKLSKLTKLSKNQVYKWLWDQRKYMKELHLNQINQTEKQKNLNIDIQFTQRLDPITSTNRTQSEKQYESLSIKGFQLEAKVDIPSNIMFACVYCVSEETSIWSRQILSKYGSQLIKKSRDKKQKQEKQLKEKEKKKKSNQENRPIMNFKEVKELQCQQKQQKQ